MFSKLDINLSGGIKKDFFVDPDEKFLNNLTCPICQFIVFEPQLCSKCKVIICKSCIKNYKSHGEAEVVNCPICRNRLETEEMEESDLEFLNKMDLRCIYSVIGCYSIVEYKNLRHHIENCDFALFSCNGKNCNYRNIKRKVINHVNTCKFLLIECQYCGRGVERGLRESHLNMCDKNVEDCPRCKKTFQKSNLIPHFYDECYKFDHEICLENERKAGNSIEELKNVLMEKTQILKEKIQLIQQLRKENFQSKLKHLRRNKSKSMKFMKKKNNDIDKSKHSCKSTDDESKFKPSKHYQLSSKFDSNPEVFLNIISTNELLKKKRIKK
jgi:hypothetical protein